ncbi:MAG: hypothetical protein K6C96_12295, partial [Butyrivibrio sp.]|nr:hypothetical protein [Butyrivibrio sp.]
KKLELKGDYRTKRNTLVNNFPDEKILKNLKVRITGTQNTVKDKDADIEALKSLIENWTRLTDMHGEYNFFDTREVDNDEEFCKKMVKKFADVFKLDSKKDAKVLAHKIKDRYNMPDDMIAVIFVPVMGSEQQAKKLLG